MVLDCSVMFFLYMLFSISSLFILTCECTVARKKVVIEKYILLFSIAFGVSGDLTRKSVRSAGCVFLQFRIRESGLLCRHGCRV